MATVNATKELAGNVRAEVHSKELELQLQQLRDDLSALAKSVAAVGSDKASEVRGKVRKATNDATDASLQMVDAAKAQAKSLERDLEAQIRTNPIQSVAIAAGVGFVFALLTRR